VTDLQDTFRQRGLGASSGFGDRPGVIVVDFSLGFTDPASPLGADYAPQLDATRTLLDAARTRAAAGRVHDRVVPGRAARGDALPREGPVPGAAARRVRLGGPRPAPGRPPGRAGVGETLRECLLRTAPARLAAGAACGHPDRVRRDHQRLRARTVVDGLQHGYRVIVPRECVGDRAAAPHDASLFDMNAKYADVLPLAEVLTHLPPPS